MLPGDTPVLTIRQNSALGLNPSSTVLANFTNPAGQGPATSLYTFTPTTSFKFLANTKYWLYLSASAGSFTWRGSNDGTTNTPSGIATFGAYRQTANGGTTFSPGSNFNSFAVGATPVPWETSDAVLPPGYHLLWFNSRRKTFSCPKEKSEILSSNRYR